MITHDIGFEQLSSPSSCFAIACSPKPPTKEPLSRLSPPSRAYTQVYVHMNGHSQIHDEHMNRYMLACCTQAHKSNNGMGKQAACQYACIHACICTYIAASRRRIPYLLHRPIPDESSRLDVCLDVCLSVWTAQRRSQTQRNLKISSTRGRDEIA